MSQPEVKPTRSSEKTFFEAGNVKVTDARFVTGNQTYVMRNVSSVKPTKTHGPRMGLAIFFGLLASFLAMCVCFAVESGSVLVSLLFGILAAMFALAALGHFGQKFQYNVVLTTNSGEAAALTSPDEALIATIIEALNEALVHG